jgi:hypothetical protein
MLQLPRTMSLLEKFDPPAHLPDFYQLPGLAEAWHHAMSSWFDFAIANERSVLPAEATVQFFNPAKFDPGSPVVEQAITWNAFPKELLRRYGRDRALREADTVWPLSRYSAAFQGPVFDQTMYRPLNEYCEWHLVRNPQDGKINKITFSSEPPEYWQALYGGTYAFDDGKHSFPGSPERVLELYKQLVSPDVAPEDLVAQHDVGPTTDGDLLVRKGEYNPYNKWNTTHGIVHLCAPPNTLLAEIQLGADGTVIRRNDRGRIIVEADPLICCARYGGPDRNSDPTIGATINALARIGAYITLRNPVGLYMDHIDLSGWNAPAGVDLDSCIKITRGSPGLIERLVVEMPEASGYSVGDLTIGGVPIVHGGQIAECITVNLVGVAVLAGVKGTSIGCTGRCGIDASDAVTLDRAVPLEKPLPVGKQLAFVNEGLAGSAANYTEAAGMKVLAMSAETEASSLTKGPAPKPGYRRGHSHRAP